VRQIYCLRKLLDQACTPQELELCALPNQLNICQLRGKHHFQISLHVQRAVCDILVVFPALASLGDQVFPRIRPTICFMLCFIRLAPFQLLPELELERLLSLLVLELRRQPPRPAPL
jgi:hypothetical protein